MGRTLHKVRIAADTFLPFVVDRIATIEVKKAQREEEVVQLKKSESRYGSLVSPCEEQPQWCYIVLPNCLKCLLRHSILHLGKMHTRQCSHTLQD